MREIIPKSKIPFILNADTNCDLMDLFVIEGYKGDDSAVAVQNWIESKDVLEFLGLWKNPTIRNHPSRIRGVKGYCVYCIPQKWIDTTNAIEIQSKPGRNDGTFAHRKLENINSKLN